MSVQINVAANQAALISSIQAGVQAYNQRFANNNQINLNINARAFSQPLGRITGDVKDFEAALAASNARVIAFGASTAVLGGVIRSFKELASVTIDVEKNLADINRVFGLSTSQLQKFSTELFNVSKQTASTFDNASKAALEFSRQGLKAEETLQRTKDALTLTRLAGIGTANAVDALTSTVNGFAATGVTTSQILNKLIAVEQDFAVGAGDLAEALSRTGQAAQEAGVSLDQLNALVTSAQQSTARGGAVIGNALKTIFTRLQRTETLDQLEAFNIAVRDVQGNILPAVTILQNFAGAYKNLADAQRAQLSEQVAGVYQVNILKAIVNDLNQSQGIYAGALQRGAMATNEAEIATAKLNKTLDALLSQTATSAQQLANNIGKVTFEPLARYGTEQLKSLIENMNEILEGEGIGSTFANGLLKGIRNILAGPGAIAAFFTLFKLIQNSFSFLTQALPQIAGITTETQNRKNIEQSILQIMQQQGPISQALAGTMGNQAAQAQLLLQLARQQTAEYQTQSALAKQLAVQLSGQGVKVAGARGLQVTRAGGYVPTATKLAEVVGAKAGGYSPGRVVPSPVGGVMNTAEDVKYIPGFAQPFINPPANSKAGRAHRQNAINRTGVDPYIANGFIPNFAKLDERDYTFASQSGGRFDKKQRSNNSYSILINKVSSDDLGAEKDLDLVGRNLDAGFNNKTKKPNGIYDWVSGIIDVRKFLNKDQVDSAITNLWTGLLKNDKNLIKKGQSIGLSNNDLAAVINTTKRKVGFTLSELKEKYRLSLDPQAAQANEYFKYKNSNKSGIKAGDPIKTAEGFEKSLNGDYQNFIGDAYEKLVSKIPGVSDKFVISQKQTSPADLIPDPAFIGPHPIQGIESKAGGAFLSQLIKKAIRINIKSRADDNRDKDLNFGTLPVYQPFGSDIQTSFRGFIPNFAPPTSAIRIPWFKKFGNASFDAIQPTLGISKASDTDTFRSKQFRSKAFDKAATDGDPNLFAPLYEDFVFKAMQLVLQPDIKDELIRGYLLEPGSDRKVAAFDAGLKKLGIGLEYKGYPKGNLTGTIGGELKRKYETLSKNSPDEAAKLKELIIIFNEIAHENQLPSEMGKSLFGSLAGTSYSQMAKNNPDLVKGLSAETNMLLERYVKDPTFLAMSAANGFIPNFAKKAQAMPPRAKSAEPYRRGISWWWETKKGYISAIQKAKNSYEIEGIEVYDKYKGQGESSKFYKGIAEKIGPGNYITGVLLPQEQALADYASGKSVPAKAIFPQLSWAKMAKSSKLLVNGKEMAISDFEKGIANHKYNAAKLEMALIELINSHASGFIPNFADLIQTEIDAILQPISKSKTIKSKQLFGKTLDDDAIKYLNITTLDRLNKFLYADGYLDVALGFPFGDRAYEKYLFTKNKGFIPNFAYKQSVMSLEESMSGNKAIFDTKPFPHIRNSSQPTFSSAIADHGGLTNALSDSMRGQKAAGLMSKGFIPNFVKYGPSYSYMPSGVPSGSSDYYPSGNPNKSQAVSPTYQAPAAATNATFQQNDIDKALQDFVNSVQAADQKLGIFESTFGGRTKIIDSELVKLKNTLSKGGVSGSKLNEALDNASKKINSEQTKLGKALEKSSTTLAIAGPLIAGQLEQLFFANKKRTELSETERSVQSGLSTGLTSISTGASIGAAFGPLGAGIGAATGALVGLTSALSATKLSAEELADLNQEQTQKAQANISAASSYIEAQKSLTQMIASGASSSDIENASKKLSDNFNEIKDIKLQEIFNATGGDVKKMTEELQKYTNETTKKSATKRGLLEKVNIEDRISALNIGLDKEQKKSIVENLKNVDFRKFRQQKQNLTLTDQIFRSSYVEAVDTSNYNSAKQLSTQILSSIGVTPETDPNFNSTLKAAMDQLLGMSISQIDQLIAGLEKGDIVSGANEAAINFKQAATRSFNQIFLDMEQQIAKTAFETALSFEKDSGSRRIQSAILDFSTNFQDSINSFLSNNLPDARKFDFTANTAAQKAQLQLQKSQQDYNKALAEQENEKSNFLIKNAENLTKEFKSSFLPSQAAAQFYQSNVLPQIQKGTFSADAKSLAQQFEKASFQEAESKFSEAGMAGSLNINDIPSELNRVTKVMEALADAGLTNENQYKKLQEAQKALIDLQNQTALFQNKNEMTKLQGVIDTAAREKELFETKQANAKKELEINKQLSDARIAVEKDIAVEKARVDKENLMRTESMKDLSANIGNALEISKARSTAAVNAMQRRLEDQRETYGMSRTQISERKFAIQSDILKEQRAAEDAAINAEIQQRVLEMAAEQENTAATLKLNDTIMSLIETQLRGALGGSVKIEEINAMRMAGVSPESIDNALGKNTYAQYEAFQRIQESRAASASNNTGYNTSTFESNIQSKSFNEKMTQAEQLTFLEQEETAARKAGNVVLAGTIKRYQEQITTKKDALQITRDDIDAQVRLNVEVERVNNTFAGRFKKGWGNLKSEGNDLILNLGENLPRMFGDGLVDGIKAAIRESDNLGDALMGIASKFLDEVSTIMMRAGIYQILGSFGFGGGGGAFSFGQKQKGGLIRAQSGMYISGTGSGDKYPALLENGEYVLNRRAVMAMGGPSALDTLNFSMAPRFASGGSFKSELSDIKSMEEGMTTFGLENSSYYRELRDEESRRAEEARQRKRQKQAERAQLIGSIVASVATAAIGAGLQNISSNAQAKAAEQMVTSGAGAAASAGLSKYGDTPQLYAETGLTKTQVQSYKKAVSSGYLNPSGTYTLKTPRSGIKSVLPPSTKGRQTGGLIGSRLSDTIPGYMEGGLYNSPIIKRYGTGMQAGGMSSIANNSNVVNNSNASNSFNFNTTVNRDGTIQMGANNTSYKQQDVELSENLNNRIYGAVLEVIRDQQRFGGSLAGTRKA